MDALSDALKRSAPTRTRVNAETSTLLQEAIAARDLMLVHREQGEQLFSCGTALLGRAPTPTPGFPHTPAPAMPNPRGTSADGSSGQGLERVFTNARTGKPFHSVRQVFGRACERAGIDPSDVTLHTLRDTALEPDECQRVRRLHCHGDQWRLIDPASGPLQEVIAVSQLTVAVFEAPVEGGISAGVIGRASTFAL